MNFVIVHRYKKSVVIALKSHFAISPSSMVNRKECVTDDTLKVTDDAQWMNVSSVHKAI